MPDYQPLNGGPPDMLAARNAAWTGYQGIGFALPASTISYLNNLDGWAAPTEKAPDNLERRGDFINWYQSHGYDFRNPEDNGEVEGVASPDFWRKQNPNSTRQWQTVGSGAWMSPDGKYTATGKGGGAYEVRDNSRGPGEQSYAWYNPDGSFNRSFTGAKNMTNWQGVLSVIGAAFGFGALGAAAAGGGAAVGAGGTAAGTGLSYTAAGAPVFGVVDTGVAAGAAGGAAAGAGAGISYTASGAPVFGVVDTTAGAGITSYTASGAPVFGAIDEGAAAASRATLATQAGGAGGAAGGGSGGGGGTTGGGAASGTEAAKAGVQTLGSSAVKDKLVGSLVSAGASSLLSSLFSPKPDMSAPTVAAPAEPRAPDTKTKAVSEMPDPLAQTRARKRSLVEQLGRRGRASTILTSPSGRLGS